MIDDAAEGFMLPTMLDLKYGEGKEKLQLSCFRDTAWLWMIHHGAQSGMFIKRLIQVMTPSTLAITWGNHYLCGCYAFANAIDNNVCSSAAFMLALAYPQIRVRKFSRAWERKSFYCCCGIWHQRALSPIETPVRLRPKGNVLCVDWVSFTGPSQWID